MLFEEDFDYALDKGLIDFETKELIEEYNERLIENNVPIIYNLRHLRKFLDSVEYDAVQIRNQRNAEIEEMMKNDMDSFVFC